MNKCNWNTEIPRPYMPWNNYPLEKSQWQSWESNPDLLINRERYKHWGKRPDRLEISYSKILKNEIEKPIGLIINRIWVLHDTIKGQMIEAKGAGRRTKSPWWFKKQKKILGGKAEDRKKVETTSYRTKISHLTQ